MVRRTRKESTRVKLILSTTPTAFLSCRANRRHALGEPDVAVDLIPGLRDLVVTRTCADCGTTRTDSFTVRVHSDSRTIFAVSADARRYDWPNGYSLTAEDPAISGLEWLSEYLTRIVASR